MTMATEAPSLSDHSLVQPNEYKYFMEKLLVEIQEHFDNQELVDVIFKLKNPTTYITAHRLILSSASAYFRELFRSDDGTCPIIEMKDDIDSDVFERLIAFCYSGHTLITMENVEEMLKSALLLQLEDAIADCVNFLIQHINDYTLDHLYALENETECELLIQKLLEYTIANFSKVIQNAQFLNFNAEKLQKIIESDDLSVREQDAFEAVKLWYEHDPPERTQHLPDLISSLRLTQLDRDFIISKIQPLPGCEVIALNAVSDTSTGSLRFPKPRATDTTLMALNLYGGNNRTIWQYNKIVDKWQKWCDIDTDINYIRVLLMDDNLIFIGGRRNNKTINEVRSWNFKTKTLKELPPMRESRGLHGVAILNNEIYAMGGEGANGEALQSVEIYSPHCKRWRPTTNMITPRRYARAVAFCGKIYVVGGWNGGENLNLVECYDPETECWTKCPDMNAARSNPGVTVHNGQIFVVGGNIGGWIYGSTIERYDPQRCEWLKVGSSVKLFHLVGTISIENQLWTVGGRNNEENHINDVSVYDEQNDKWIEKEPIPIPGSYYCFEVPKSLLQSES